MKYADSRILIIDDEPDIREILAFELKDDAHIIIECDGFKNAKRCLTEQSFDLIISDMSLGDGNGLQLLRFLREELGQKTPFMLMSGDFTVQDEKVKAAGGEGLVAKPFCLPDLVPQIFELAHRGHRKRLDDDELKAS